MLKLRQVTVSVSASVQSLQIVFGIFLDFILHIDNSNHKNAIRKAQKGLVVALI